MAQFSLNQNFDIGLVPNDWNATPVSTSIDMRPHTRTITYTRLPRVL
jgi:hypothetical protein